MKVLNLWSLMLLLPLSVNAQVLSQTVQDDYEITVTETYDSEQTPGFAPDIPAGAVGFAADGSLDLGQVHNTLGSILEIGKDVVAIGEFLYKIVDAGKPVTNVKYAPISVLPKVASGAYADTLEEMEGWSLPRVKKFSVAFKNGFGVEVIRYDYTLIFSYNGSYEGKGKYITGAQIIPDNVSVSWGFNFESSYKLANVANMGTKLAPVALATINLDYKVRPIIPLKNIDQTVSISITGDGQVQVN